MFIKDENVICYDFRATGGKIICKDCVNANDITNENQIITEQMIEDEDNIFCDACGEKIH